MYPKYVLIKSLDFLAGDTGWTILIVTAVIAFAFYYLMRLEKKKRKDDKTKLYWLFSTLYYLSLLFILLVSLATVAGQTSLNVNSYGLMLAIAFLVGVYLMTKKAKKEGISEGAILDLSLIGIVVSLLGSRLFYMLLEYVPSDGTPTPPPFAFFNNPLAFFNFSSGGLVVYGGFICGILFGLLFIKYKKLPLGKIADISAPTIALGVGLVRFGCNMAGCCFGARIDHDHFLALPLTLFKPDSPVIFTYADKLQLPINEMQVWAKDVYLWPTQLISSANGLIMFLILEIIYIKYRAKLKFDGFIFIIFMIYYAVTRYLIEMLRDDTPKSFWGLSAAQATGIMVLGLAVILMIYNLSITNTKNKKQVI